MAVYNTTATTTIPHPDNKPTEPKPCPTCGRCPTCGHGAAPVVPYFPWWPTPVYPATPWIIYSTQYGTGCPDAS